MAKREYIDYKRLQKELFQRTEGYATNVKEIYRQALSEVIDLVKGTELLPGKPFTFSEYGYDEDILPIMRNMYSRVVNTIGNGVKAEWLKSNEHNDGLVNAIFGGNAIDNNLFARYFQHNMEAMTAFLERKAGGLNLSQRVWKYTGNFKDELEDALDLAIGEGTAANRLATKIQKYLQEPDRFYRRFRVKIGDEPIFDDEGNEIGKKPIYGRIWKRRIYDNEAQGYRWIDADPKKYHPGRGVYRSSYRNAQRLARTETNMAYRMADFDRWDELDFVIGIEIKLSNNHPFPDICDDLAGIYPKTFKWRGWHPNCRCYQVPVLAKEEEIAEMLDKLLEGEEPSTVKCADAVQQYPPQFKQWVKNNGEKLEQAETDGKLPYFVADNKKVVANILHGLTPEQRKALSMADLLDNPMELLAKHGIKDLEALYAAVQKGLDKFLTGSLEHQIDTLNFEIDWVTKYKKYPTWEGAANAYKKALAKVEAQLRERTLKAEIDAVGTFAVEKNIDEAITHWANAQVALEAGDIAAAQTYLMQAQRLVDEYKAAEMTKGMTSTSDIEMYCDKHRTFKSKVTGQSTFEKFQEKMIGDCQDAWLNGSIEARNAVSGYTNGTYDEINRSYWKYHTPDERGTLMDEILDGCTIKRDMVLRRGADMTELGSIFGDDFLKLLNDKDVDGLNALAGRHGVNEGFISTSFDMQGGFWKGVDLRIYAPKGTQALYAKPISGYGDGYHGNWDAKSANTRFERGRENEVIVHRGYEYRFIKAELPTGVSKKNHSSIVIYVELLDRSKRVVK